MVIDIKRHSGDINLTSIQHQYRFIGKVTFSQGKCITIIKYID